MSNAARVQQDDLSCSCLPLYIVIANNFFLHFISLLDSDLCDRAKMRECRPFILLILQTPVQLFNSTMCVFARRCTESNVFVFVLSLCCFLAARPRITASRRLLNKQWPRQLPQKTGKVPVVEAQLWVAVCNTNVGLICIRHFRDPSSRAGPQKVQSHLCQSKSWPSASEFSWHLQTKPCSHSQVHAVEKTAFEYDIYSNHPRRLEGKHHALSVLLKPNAWARTANGTQ